MLEQTIFALLYLGLLPLLPLIYAATWLAQATGLPPVYIVPGAVTVLALLCRVAWAKARAITTPRAGGVVINPAR